MPKDWCNHIPLVKTPQSEAGEPFRSASGHKIYNHGQRIVFMMTREGNKRDMKFTVCDVSEALGSVSQMCRARYRVFFNPTWIGEGSCIQHVEPGERLWLEEHNGLYMFNTRVAPATEQSTMRSRPGDKQEFGWPGLP